MPATNPALVYAWRGCRAHVDFLSLILLHDAVHEVEEFQPASAFIMTARELAGADIQSGEQGRGPVPLIIMRLIDH